MLHQVPPRPWWLWTPTRFHVAPDLIAYIRHLGDEEVDIWVGAGHRGVLRPLGELDLNRPRFDG
ncbi:hypothetical protein [Streptomyces sannanensis]